jgi:hypothetical protein
MYGSLYKERGSRDHICDIDNAHEQTRRCRFIAHIADSSALGGFPTIQIISLKVIICHKINLSTLLLCDDLSGEDQDNVSTITEFGGHILMKILVMPKPIEGVSREELLQHAPAEIRAVWGLYEQGICREFYTRVNEPGRVVLMLECATLEAAKEALATLPFAQLHLIDFDVIPLAPFLGLSRLFQAPTEEPVGKAQ